MTTPSKSSAGALAVGLLLGVICGYIFGLLQFSMLQLLLGLGGIVLAGRVAVIAFVLLWR